MKKSTLVLLVILFAGIFLYQLPAYTEQNSETQNILLKDYEHVAIATDLEPDDVLALLLIFKEANRQYAETGKYPIDLVIVGEGNTAIKKMRMEALLNHMNLPVEIKVVEGKSTRDNIFPLDGEELFDKSELQKIPFKDNSGENAVKALSEFLADSDNPLIIQIKPAQELLSIPSELAKKTTVIFYGSFNFRKIIKEDYSIEKLQALLDYFGNNYKKVGIVESYGILGEQSSVYSGYPWTDRIRTLIEGSDDSYLIMFRKLVHNWNSYLLQAELPEIRTYLSEIIKKNPNQQLHDALTKLDNLIKEWNEDLFLEIYSETMPIMEQIRAQDPMLIDKFERGMKFANQLKPSSGVQFTLSDVGVALVLSDKTDFFKSSPGKIHINKYGFIENIKTPDSNVFYYDRIDRAEFSKILEETLIN